MVPTSSARALRACSPPTAVINAYRHATYHSQQCIRPVFAPARLDLSVRAGNGESEALPQTMTAEEAYKVLDLTQSSSFEDVVQAKNRKLAAADGDMEKAMQVEAAYDALFMTAMNKRMKGELEVSQSVRFADVQKVRKAAPAKAGFSGKASKQQVAQVAGVSLAVPTDNKFIATQVGVYSGLAVWALMQVLIESPEAQLADTAALQLTAAGIYTTYTLKQTKNIDLGLAVGVSIASTFAGALLGTAIHNWVRVDIVPLGSFGSPGAFVSEVVIALQLVCSLLVV